MTPRRPAAVPAAIALAAGLTVLWHAVLFASAELVPVFDEPYLSTTLINLSTVPVALAAAFALRDWRLTGFAPTPAHVPASPRRTRALLVLPLFAVNLVYLAQGFEGGPETLLRLAGLCLAVGIAEESLSRGVVQHVLGGMSPMATAACVAVLFGLGHALSGAWFEAPLEDVAFQVVSTTTFGFGYATARFHLATVWPLVAAHALDDHLQLASPGAAPWPVQLAVAVGFVAYGWWLLRGRNNGATITS
ncbi:MAG TPA: CPBP family intramembrane glutamic endopeptidase [Phytomonospora sp.]